MSNREGPHTMLFMVTEHFTKTARHGNFYLASGPESGPLIIFVHGRPERSYSWRHQLRCFAALGFRCVAPDMRGYGRSSNYNTHADYALEHSVLDMLDLLADVGRDRPSGSVTTGAAHLGRSRLGQPSRLEHRRPSP